MIKILVVEDDSLLRDLIIRVLKRHNFITFEVITDIMMPKMDGYEFVNSLRHVNINIPILMVTAMDQYRNKEIGFSVGIDDYMVKPIDIKEMILRVNALLRRSKIASEHEITIGKTTLYYDELRIENNIESLILPQKEFYLLFKLLSYPNKIFTRMQLMDDIWGMDTDTSWRTIDVHINRLRERTIKFSDFEIITIRGIGYKAAKKS